MRGLGFTLGVMVSANESCGGEGVSLATPYVNIGNECTGECYENANIFSIAQFLAESWMDSMFVESSGMH